MLNNFLSCDWGTTSFRLKLVERESFRILGAVSSNRGIASTYKAWNDNGADPGSRRNFYLDVIRQGIADLERRLDASLTGVPVVISGMASSSIGMMDLPYKELPFSVDGSDLLLNKVAAREDFPNDVTLISGVRTQDDVMRGEEIQLVGAFSDKHQSGADLIYIFPGTHSKHVVVDQGRAVGFRTYMTGELFALLATNSILAGSVEAGGDFQLQSCRKSFEEGVVDGLEHNLLNRAFHVRAKSLLSEQGKELNYFFLSGLVLGTELKDLKGGPKDVVIVASNDMLPYYEAALKLLSNIRVAEFCPADWAVRKGHSVVSGL